MEILRNTRKKGEGNETHGDRSLSLLRLRPLMLPAMFGERLFSNFIDVMVWA